MTDYPPCNAEVFKRGESLGLFPQMNKHDAEAYCKSQTTITGDLHDWHFAGGRVRILRLRRDHDGDSDGE